MTITLAAPTSAPTRPGRAHLPWTVTLTDPMHHGAGTKSNVSRLRKQRLTIPLWTEGETAPGIEPGNQVYVPFLSGNSMRHQLRAALAWHLVTTLGVEWGSMTKYQVDLLFSGGALTETGSETLLELMRRIELQASHLALLGYSAKSSMTEGTLKVNFTHLVCAENRFRLPPRLLDTPHARRRAATFLGQDFGTRHDIAGTPADRLISLVGDMPKTTQMIHTMQLVEVGAVLHGSLNTTAATTAEQKAALLVALDEVMPLEDGVRVVSLGAKSAVGYGRGRVDVDLSVLGDVDAARAWWEEHLRAHRDDVLALLSEIVG